MTLRIRHVTVVTKRGTLAEGFGLCMYEDRWFPYYYHSGERAQQVRDIIIEIINDKGEGFIDRNFGFSYPIIMVY